MHLVFFTFLIISLLLLILGIDKHRRLSDVKEIDYFPLNGQIQPVFFSKNGSYSVVLFGGTNIENFLLDIFFINDGEKVKLSESKIKSRVIKNGVIGVAFYEFTIKRQGKYGLHVKNYDNLSVKVSSMKLFDTFQSIIPIKKLSISIREYSSPLNSLFATLSIIVGLMLLILDITFLLYKIGILVPTK